MVHGIMAILKPPGMTSHDVVAKVRRWVGQKRVGHTGTLDPGAAGVLVLCLGHATRLIPFMENYVKAYRAELCFGWSTDTQDAGGRVLEEKRDFLLPLGALHDILYSLKGDNQQVPPMVSALKYKGKRLYELARKGKVVKREPRHIRIYDIKPVKQSNTNTLKHGERLLFDITCSKGTYVRTLCHDIGTLIEIPSHMSFLLRTRVGPWGLEHVSTLEALEDNPTHQVFAMEQGIAHLPGVSVTQEGALMLSQGAQISKRHVQEVMPPEIEAFYAIGGAGIPEGLLRVFDGDNRFIGVGRRLDALGPGWKIQPFRMLPQEAK